LNKENFSKVLKRIKGNLAAWDQDAWNIKRGCGTAYCFAGHAEVLATGHEGTLDGPTIAAYRRSNHR